MSEMIERVAEAVLGAPSCLNLKDWSEGVARAAIEAMREPTEEMEVVAGNQAYIINYYKAMIDAALK